MAESVFTGCIPALMTPCKADRTPDFEALVDQWIPVTLLVNSLNRSLGQEDAYPFALSSGALEKLRFIHDVIVQRKRSKDGAVSPP